MRHSALNHWVLGPHHNAPAKRVVVRVALATFLVVVASAVSSKAHAASGDVALCDLAVSLKLKKVKKTLAGVDAEFRQQWQSQRPDDKLVTCERYFMANEELRINRMAQFGEENGVRYVVAPAAFPEKNTTKVSIWVIDAKKKAKIQSVVIDLPSKRSQLKSRGAVVLSSAIADLGSSLPGSVRAAPMPVVSSATPVTAAPSDGKTLVCDLAVSIKLKGLRRPLGVLYDEFVGQWKNARAQDLVSECKRYFMANEELRVNKMAAFGKDVGAKYVIAPGVYKDKGGANHLSVWKIDVDNRRKIEEVSIEIPKTASAIAAQAAQLAREAVDGVMGRATLGIPSAAPSVAAATTGPRVALCDAAVSVKLKNVRSDIQELENQVLRLWQNSRPGDQAMQCRRYFMEKPAIRLNKLVSFGQKAQIDYLYAPAVYEESDQSVRISIWLVDVAAQRQLAEILVPLPSTGSELRQNGPSALVRPIAELRAVLEAKIAGRALPPVSTYATAPSASSPTLVSARPTANAAARPDNNAAIASGNNRATPMPVAQNAAGSIAPGPNAVGTESVPSSANPALMQSVPPVSPTVVAGSSNGPVMRMVMINSAGALLGAGLAASATAAGLTGVAMSLNQFKQQARLETGDYEQLQGMVMGVSAGADASWAAAGIAGVAGVALLSGTLLWVEE